MAAPGKLRILAIAALGATALAACAPRATAIATFTSIRLEFHGHHERAPTSAPARAESDSGALRVAPHREADGLVVRVIHRFMTEVPTGAPGGVCSSFDLDGDGAPEGLWLKRVREEWDHDGDGRIDEVYHFDDRGDLEAWDLDADGVVDYDWRRPVAPPRSPPAHSAPGRYLRSHARR